MKLHPREFRRLVVLLFHFGQGRRSVELSSLRLAHILSVPEVRVLELLTMMTDEDYITISGMSEEVLKKKETKQELKVSASPYEERCRLKHAEVGVKWGFSPEDYVIYDISAVYCRERARRTAVPYMVFSLKRDPRRQPAWGTFRRTYEQLKEYGWDVDKYTIAQIEETAWCKAFIFIPSTWFGTDKAKERMFKWLEKSKKESLHTKKDSGYDQSKHLVDSIMRSRKDVRTVMDVLAIPGVIEQLDADYLKDVLQEPKPAST